MRRKCDRGPTLPGLTPARLDEDGAGSRARHFGRHTGPWKKPARLPCDFKRDNGLICDLESVRSWCSNSGKPLHTHEPGTACGANIPIRNRCALHPMEEGA